MRFTIIHKHVPEVKRAVEAFVIDAVKKGYKFDANPARAPFFQTLPHWPSPAELDNIPFDVQVSEVEIVNVEQLITKKSLILDILSEIVIEPPPPTSTETSSENPVPTPEVVVPAVETPQTGSTENTGSL